MKIFIGIDIINLKKINLSVFSKTVYIGSCKIIIFIIIRF